MTKLCLNCGKEIGNRTLVDGKIRNTQRRKFCVDCSPFGSHNTQPLLPTGKCPCGEKSLENYYGNKTRRCAKCHLDYCNRKGNETKAKAREYLGGKCKYCGFDKYQISLDIHHCDPSQKDPNFKSMRGWSWERLKKELDGCELVCKNCHGALHHGLLVV